jgi:hypothetical protein
VAICIAEIRRLVATGTNGLCGQRARALLLGFAAVLRRSEPVGGATRAGKHGSISAA